MDRPIEPHELRRQTFHRIAGWTLAAVALMVLALAARAWIRPALSAGRLRIATDHYEIVSGLDAGDRVIISNMTDYLHLERIRIR